MFTRSTMRSKAWLFIVSAVVLIFVALSACSQGQEQGQTNGTTLNNSQNPITIGISIPLDKDFAADGIATEQGYQLWADMVNSNGGILGRPVKLVILNDHSDPGQTAKDYTTLITKDHVDLIFGPFSSLLTKAAAPVAQKYHYALLEGEGGAPSVFHPDPSVNPQGRWNGLFDVSVPIENNLVTFAYYILSLPRSLRPRTVAYLTSDDPFTFPQLDPVRKLLGRGGVKELYYKMYTEGSDPTPYAEQVVQSHADIVILGTLLPDIKADIQVFKKEHYNPRAIIATAGPDLGRDFITAVGGIKYTEGIFVPNGWFPQADNFQNAQMIQAYISRYGGTPDQINADVAEAFSVGQVFQQAAESIHSIDNSKLIAKLYSGDVFTTVQGTARFDRYGENVQGLAYLFQWQSGQFIPVYPLPVALNNPEYPRPPDF